MNTASGRAIKIKNAEHNSPMPSTGIILLGKTNKPSVRNKTICINNIDLDFEGLYPVLLIGLQFATFSATEALHGNGFLAVYLCALYLGNQSLIHKKNIDKSL